MFYIPYFDPRSQPNGPRKDQVKRIGSFTFNCAPRNATHPNRETKNIQIADIFTQYIKLDCFQPYDHEQNIFN
jgi:hypothetical protein